MAFCKLLLTLLVLLHNSGGPLGAEVKSAIIGGENAKKGGWPWMVHLNLTTSDGKIQWRCGGSIVSRNWVMTSASCVNKTHTPSHHRSSVWVGSYELAKPSARYMAITHFVPHPGYLPNDFTNDLALIKLKKTIEFSDEVHNVTLAQKNDRFTPLSECWITGWGNVGKGVKLPYPETLQQLKVPIMPQSECAKVFPRLNPAMLCTGAINGGKDACDGDDGGPLVCRKEGGFVQVGILSSGNCGQGKPTIYTRVSEYLDFITHYINLPDDASTED